MHINCMKILYLYVILSMLEHKYFLFNNYIIKYMKVVLMLLRFQTRMLYNHNQNIKKGYLKISFYKKIYKKL